MLGPRYFTIEQVKPYLQGKVDFGPDDEREIDDEFLSTICYQSEAEVLADLNQFYEVPLRSITHSGEDKLTLVPPDAVVKNLDGSLALNWTTEPDGWELLTGAMIPLVRQNNNYGTFNRVGPDPLQLTLFTYTHGVNAFNTVDPVEVTYYHPRESYLPEFTKGYLLNLFITKAVFDILNEDFGQKSNVVGDDMLTRYEKKYYRLLGRFTAKDPKTGQFKYALLPDLAVNKGNWTGRKIIPRPMSTNSGLCTSDNMKYAIRQNITPATGWVGGGLLYGSRGCNPSNRGRC